jgi:hypothetical protein
MTVMTRLDHLMRIPPLLLFAPIMAASGQAPNRAAADSVNIVLLTNSNVSPATLALNIVRMVLDSPSGPARGGTRVSAPIPQPLADSDRDRVIGVYDVASSSGSTLVLRVTLVQGGLVAHADGAGQRALPLVHRGNLRFATAVDRGIALTFVEENGKITSLRFEQGSTTFVGTRRP